MHFQIENSNLRVMGTLHLFPRTERESPVPGWAQVAQFWPASIYTETEPSQFQNVASAPLGYDAAQFLSIGLRRDIALIFGSNEALPAFKLWALTLAAPGKLMLTTPGYEAFLAAAARQRAIPHQYLETAEEFAALMEEIPPAALVGALDFLVRNPALPQANLLRMYEAWASRNSDQMLNIFRESPLFATPSLYEAVIVRRNRAWVKRIRNMVDTPTNTLIAVGALHLCGTDNLMDMLGLPYKVVP